MHYLFQRCAVCCTRSRPDGKEPTICEAEASKRNFEKLRVYQTGGELRAIHKCLRGVGATNSITSTGAAWTSLGVGVTVGVGITIGNGADVARHAHVVGCSAWRRRNKRLHAFSEARATSDTNGGGCRHSS